MTTTRNTEV